MPLRPPQIIPGGLHGERQTATGLNHGMAYSESKSDALPHDLKLVKVQS